MSALRIAPSLITTLRAKGTLISEPRFSTPCEMRFFPREKGRTAFSKKNPRQGPFSLSRVGKITSRRMLDGGCLGMGWLIYRWKPRETWQPRQPRDENLKRPPFKTRQPQVFRGIHSTRNHENHKMNILKSTP